MKTSKEVALTVAGIVALLTTGQTMVQAASTAAANQKAEAQVAISMDDMVAGSATNTNIKFADQNIRVTSNSTVSSKKIADETKSSADKAAEKAAKVAKETAAKQEAAEKAEKAAAEKAAKEAEAEAKAEQEAAEKAAKEAEKAAEEQAAAQAKAEKAAVATQTATATETTVSAAPAGSGSVYDQFIAAGGTPALWQTIVLPESGGNPNIVSPNGYRGLGQTKEGWGAGSVAQQTQGMLGYAASRYGSVEGALQFRNANGWW